MTKAGTPMESPLRQLREELERVPPYTLYGSVSAVLGMMVEVAGAHRSLSIGDRCRLVTRQGQRVPCEVVGFRAERALLMPFGTLDGIGIGCKAEMENAEPMVYPHEGWLGRVVNALGEPVIAVISRLSRMPASRLARRWISACGRSTPSCPPAVASAWASSPAPASASRS